MWDILSWKKWVERNEGSSDFLDTTKKVAWVLAATIIATSSANADELKIWEKVSFPATKEYKVNKISEVKKICANVAEDIDGWKYVVKLPTSLYERYRFDIMEKFPNDEGCTFVIATRDTRTSPNTEVIYTSAFWDTDASDIVAEVDNKLNKVNNKLNKVNNKLNKVKRLALMNPTREFWNFAKDFDKYFDNWNYDKLLEDAKRVKKAISYPVDKDDYELWIEVYKIHIIPKLQENLERVKNINIKHKLKELKKVIDYIIKNTKTKNIWLA